MKSIKEKAKEFGILNPNIIYDADGNNYDDIDKPSMDFEDGANYVLDEIEKSLQEFYNHGQIDEFPTYEQAVEAAIQYSLKNLI